MDRAPEAVAGMGVVVPEFGRARRGGGADEDEAEVGTELVGEAGSNNFGQARRPSFFSSVKLWSNSVNQSKIEKVDSGV